MPASPFIGGSAPGPVKRVCVFCGARPGDNPQFAHAARELGRAVALAGLNLVYGGGGVGLMGIVAGAALEAGGTVTGVIPRFLLEREAALLYDHELIVVDDMATRKREMASRADAFVALPGGLGTLEELVEQLSWAKLGRHDKPLLLIDVANFWGPLVTVLRHMSGAGFVTAQDLDVLFVARNTAEAVARLTGGPGRQRLDARKTRSRPLLSEVSSEGSRHDIYLVTDHQA